MFDIEYDRASAANDRFEEWATAQGLDILDPATVIAYDAACEDARDRY